jgi:hypothetical protein
VTVWDDTIVSLEAWELLIASSEAGRRWTTSTLRGAQDRGGVRRELAKDVAGACGELAVAKWTGRYWTGGRQGAGDVDGIEVRTRRADPRDEGAELILQPYDEERRPDTPFVLVVGDGREFRIVGWTTPRRARALERAGGAQVRDPGGRGRPALFVPQLALVPPDEFRVAPVPARDQEQEEAAA